MSLPRMALAREPFHVSAAAGCDPDRSRRPGRDVSDPPVSPPGTARRPSSRLPRKFGKGRRVTHVRVDPCGKARRQLRWTIKLHDHRGALASILPDPSADH